jgi:hypothetical protein
VSLKHNIFLVELLNRNTIPFKGSIFENKAVTSEMSGSTYFETQEDTNRQLISHYIKTDDIGIVPIEKISSRQQRYMMR